METTTEQPPVDQVQPPTTEPPASPIPGGMAGWPKALGLMLGLLVLDHATKLLALAKLKPSDPFAPEPYVQVIPGCFRLQYAENTGAAFSIFEGKPQWLAIVSFIASVGLTWWWTRLPAEERWGRTALVMVLAGAVGNLIDRAFRGFVVDFFLAYWGRYSWPVFNVADTLICVGVAILMWRTATGKV